MSPAPPFLCCLDVLCTICVGGFKGLCMCVRVRVWKEETQRRANGTYETKLSHDGVKLLRFRVVEDGLWGCWVCECECERSAGVHVRAMKPYVERLHNNVEVLKVLVGQRGGQNRHKLEDVGAKVLLCVLYR